MSKTKIVLSTKELGMVTDSEWILTKQRIIQQVYVLFDSVIADIDRMILPEWRHLTEVAPLPPRIFKGENYLGLPYVTLDHPRLFESKNSLTVRTMFWWANFVSVTLHAGGIYKERLADKLGELQSSEHGDMFICIHENQWHHHFEPDNFILFQNISKKKFEEIKMERDFIKIAYKVNLQQFNELQEILIKNYQMLAEIMA